MNFLTEVRQSVMNFVKLLMTQMKGLKPTIIIIIIGVASVIIIIIVATNADS